MSNPIPQDPNWPNGATPSGDSTLARPSLTRVWQGRILAAYTSNSNVVYNTSRLYARLYDPYIGGNGWDAGAQYVEQFDCQGGPAVAYSGLTAYLFYSVDGTQILYSAVSQPPPNAQDHALEFSNPLVCSTPQPCFSIPLSNFSGIAAAVFNSSIYLFWCGAYYSYYGGYGISYAKAPLDAAPNLSFSGPYPLSGMPVSQSELSLSVFNNKLYCAYAAAPSGNLEAITLDANDVVTFGPILDTNSQPLTAAHAPALATDPNGQFLMVIYSGGTSVDNQLYSCYVRADASNSNWGDVRCVGSQSTNLSPALVATAAGEAFLMYKRDDSSSGAVNFCMSDPLLIIWNMAIQP